MGKAFFGIDLRTKGSGNLGATNTFRILGWKAALPVALVDVLKGWFPVWFFTQRDQTATWEWALAYAGAAPIEEVMPTYCLLGYEPIGATRSLGGVPHELYRYLEALGEADTLLLVSDHGFKWSDERPTNLSGTFGPTAGLWHAEDHSLVSHCYSPRVWIKGDIVGHERDCFISPNR